MYRAHAIHACPERADVRAPHASFSLPAQAGCHCKRRFLWGSPVHSKASKTRLDKATPILLRNSKRCADCCCLKTEVRALTVRMNPAVGKRTAKFIQPGWRYAATLRQRRDRHLLRCAIASLVILVWLRFSSARSMVASSSSASSVICDS